MSKTSKTRNRAISIEGANSARYQCFGIAQDYFESRYHSLRAKIAVDLLEKELVESFPNKNRSNLKILELGAASGYISKLLLPQGFRVVASDSEPEIVEHLIGSGIEALMIDVCEKFPLDDREFDAILMGELIEHVFDPGFLLDECFRVLRKGGILIITTPNLARISDRLRFLFGESPKQVDATHEFLRLHIRPFTRKSLEKILNIHSFTMLRTRSNLVKIGKWGGKSRYSRFLAKVFPSWGGSLIIAGKKRE